MKIAIPALLLFAACSAGNSMMTMSAFYEIPIGSTQTEVVGTAGEPYAVHKNDDGTVEYEYIERMKAGGRTLEERHYFLLIKDGKVISKRVEQFSPPPYIFDSYDMQTTQSSTETELE